MILENQLYLNKYFKRKRHNSDRFRKGRFFEQEVDPQMEALNQRFETLLASGASPQELDEVVFEMDRVMFEANEAAQAFEVNSFQNQFGNILN